MTCPVEEELGAYVLHALEVEEAAAVSDHLGTCRTCQDEARSLGATAGLLSLLQPEDFEEIEARDLQSRTHRPPRRWVRTAGTAALAGAALATVLVVEVGRHGGEPRPETGQAVVQAVDRATHMRAAVEMSRRESGTRLRLTLTGADPHGWCSLVAHARDGRTDTAASWWANAQGDATVSGMTAFRADQLTEFDVVTHSGRLLMRIPVSRATANDQP
jgi:hypothetical protein